MCQDSEGLLPARSVVQTRCFLNFWICGVSVYLQAFSPQRLRIAHGGIAGTVSLNRGFTTYIHLQDL